jgi:hypothetical protein
VKTFDTFLPKGYRNKELRVLSYHGTILFQGYDEDGHPCWYVQAWGISYGKVVKRSQYQCVPYSTLLEAKRAVDNHNSSTARILRGILNTQEYCCAQYHEKSGNKRISCGAEKDGCSCNYACDIEAAMWKMILG